MPTVNPTFYMLLFCTTIVLTYIVVRMNWFRVRVASVAGMVANSLSFFLFALSRGSTTTHALTLGLLLGAIFTVLSVALGRMFGKYAYTAEASESVTTAQGVKA
jgi:hypothetical protein